MRYTLASASGRTGIEVPGRIMSTNSEIADTLTAEQELELHKTKNRIVAVDITRVLAAFLVMFEHIRQFKYGGYGEYCIGTYIEAGVGYVSPVFFVLAGYFACRNITWKKALTNALWCLIPYAIWNLIAVAVDVAVMSWQDATWAQIVEGFHLDADDSVLMGGADRPLWFMRNLIFLFLLSPIIYKWARYIFPVLLFAAFFPSLQFIFDRVSFTRVNYSLYFFALGCFLRTFPKEWQDFFLRFYSPLMLAIYWGVVLLVTAKLLVRTPMWSWCGHHILGETLGLWMLYQTARWLEVKFPAITPLALKYAPVTFLTFAFHWIPMKHLPDCLNIPFVSLLYPLVIFMLMAGLYFAMKRWARPLLHAVAHYKLRPDDLAPQKR